MSVEISVSKHIPGKTVYHAGDTIEGTVKVKGPINDENARLHVKLRGTSIVKVQELWEIETTCDNIELVCEEHIHRLSSGQIKSNEERLYHFSFQIPKRTLSLRRGDFPPSPHFTNKNHALPPSLKVVGGFHRRGEISYEIVAMVVKPQWCLIKSKIKTQIPITIQRVRKPIKSNGTSIIQTRKDIVQQSLQTQTISGMFQSHKLQQISEAPFAIQYDFSVAKKTANTPAAAIARTMFPRTRSGVQRAVISFNFDIQTPSSLIPGTKIPLTLKFQYDYLKSTIEILPEIQLLSVKYGINSHTRVQTGASPFRKKNTKKAFEKMVEFRGRRMLVHGKVINVGEVMDTCVEEGTVVEGFRSFNLSHLFTAEVEVVVLCGGVKLVLEGEKIDLQVLPVECLESRGVVAGMGEGKSSCRSRVSLDSDGEESCDGVEVSPREIL